QMEGEWDDPLGIACSDDGNVITILSKYDVYRIDAKSGKVLSHIDFSLENDVLGLTRDGRFAVTRVWHFLDQTVWHWIDTSSGEGSEEIENTATNSDKPIAAFSHDGKYFAAAISTVDGWVARRSVLPSRKPLASIKLEREPAFVDF